MIVGWFIHLHNWLSSVPAGSWYGRYRQLVLRPHANRMRDVFSMHSAWWASFARWYLRS